MAVTEHLYLSLDREEAQLRRRQQIAAREEVAGNGLRVSAAEGTARPEGLTEEVVRMRGFGGAMRKRRRALDWLRVGEDEIRLLPL